MKIALLGYGKMGKAIEAIAINRGHEISIKVGRLESEHLEASKLTGSDLAIDFSTPSSAVSLISKAFDAGLPVVSGTTGWLDSWNEIESKCKNADSAFFYASNYSIGMNIMFELNRQLAAMMNLRPEYKVSMDEIHHLHKIDAPSGTAITLAEDIIERVDRLEGWKLDSNEATNELLIRSSRVGEVPGTHLINYESSIDKIQVSHEAFGREGFALGAVLAAEWLLHRKGIFGMKNLLKETQTT